MQVGDREPQREAAAMLQAAGGEQEQAGESPQQQGGHGHRQHEPGADAGLRDAQDRDPGQCRHGNRHGEQDRADGAGAGSA